MAVPPGFPGRRVSLDQVNRVEVGDSVAARTIGRARFRSVIHNRDTLTSAPSPVLDSRLSWPSYIGAKIKDGFTVAVEWVQKFLVGIVKAVVVFFSSPFKKSPKDITVEERRALSQGRATPTDLKGMLERKELSKDSKDKDVLREIYLEVGRLRIQLREKKPAEPPREEKGFGAWIGRAATTAIHWGKKTAVAVVHGTINDEDRISAGRLYLKKQTSSFAEDRIVDYQELIRTILLKASQSQAK